MSSGFRYKDKLLTPDGVRQIILKQGLTAGKPRILVRGRGLDLEMPGLPITQPVRVQLRNDNGMCWEATYSAPAKKNQLDKFFDKAD